MATHEAPRLLDTHGGLISTPGTVDGSGGGGRKPVEGFVGGRVGNLRRGLWRPLCATSPHDLRVHVPQSSRHEHVFCCSAETTSGLWNVRKVQKEDVSAKVLNACQEHTKLPKKHFELNESFEHSQSVQKCSRVLNILLNHIHSSIVPECLEHSWRPRRLTLRRKGYFLAPRRSLPRLESAATSRTLEFLRKIIHGTRASITSARGPLELQSFFSLFLINA